MHEVVVLQGRHVCELHRAGFEIDRRDRRLVHGRVVLVLEEVAQRVGDGRRVEQAGGELVQHRLEGVVVVRVHQHDLDVRILELPRGTETGEAAAEDQDPRTAAARNPKTLLLQASQKGLQRESRPVITPTG